MIDYKNMPTYKRKAQPKHLQGFAIAFLVMLATVYAIVYFADFIDSL